LDIWRTYFVNVKPGKGVIKACPKHEPELASVFVLDLRRHIEITGGQICRVISDKTKCSLVVFSGIHIYIEVVVLCSDISFYASICRIQMP